MEQATLGEIKEYLKEHNIELDVKKGTPASLSNNQTFGDPITESCFAYYVEHSTEIETWRANRHRERVANLL